MLIVFGAACVGVLVEAFVARPNRFSLQLPITMAGLGGALVAVVCVRGQGRRRAQGRRAGRGRRRRAGAVHAGDGARARVRRRAHDGRAPARPRRRRVRADGLGHARRRRRSATSRSPGWRQTEVYPLHAVRGRRHAAVPRGERPADDVRRARGALAAAVPAVRAGPPAPAASRRRPRSSTSCSARSRRRSSCSASRCCTATPGRCGCGDIADARPGRRSACEPLLLHRHRAGRASACCSRSSAVPFHSWTPDVYQGAPTPVTGFMAACTKVAAFGALLRVFYVALGGVRWDWRPMMWVVAIAHDGGRLGARGDPDRRQAAAGVLLDRARRLHPHRRAGDRAAAGVSATLFYLVDVRLHHDRRVRDRDPGPRLGRRGHAPVALGRPGQALAGRGRRCSRCSCSRSPASR